MNTSLTETSLGQIARELPGATAIFHKHKLDFCCGGAKSLAEAAAKRGLDAQAIAAELTALRPEDADGERLAELPDAELIAHILERYHEAHRADLPELIRLARRVEAVHREHPLCPTGLAEHLETMLDELAMHMHKEEQILFPMIAQGMGGMAVPPITMMRHEHDDHAEALALMEALAHGMAIHAEACNTWRALYLGLDRLKRELMEHIHLENNVLFTRFDGRLGSFAQA
ncbi:MAG: iron-sulfur cluster repair protein YtfE [Gammaproteobacteria bacterium]|nr:iron-sulfur cluster repair protein YtfE [Gammaproteobacteria bacterium]